MYSFDEQTIVACCTPQGSGALALIRLSGIDAVAITERISQLASGKKLTKLPTHTIHYGTVQNKKMQPIDTVLFLLMRGPQSFTGDDTVEITCHNNPFIIEAIIERTIKAGARIATEGEFSKRAVLNKKIDIMQAESIKEIIHANSKASLKKSLAQLDGTLSSHIAKIEKLLIKALALSDASFEFLDEEELQFTQQIKKNLTKITSKIKTLTHTFGMQKQIRDGIRIALIGSVNAGKSSLFNALLDSKRAIVTNVAGTTRDVIEAGVYENDTYITYIDTAGLRKTKNVIEKEGITRSHQEAHKADIILLLIDYSRPLSNEEKAAYESIMTQYENKIIPIASKSDLPQKEDYKADKALSISEHNQKQITALKKAITTKISGLLATHDSPYMLTKRQHTLLKALESKLEEVMPLLSENCPYELVSYHLNEALSELAELTGKSISEAAMDAVFREFCVGK